MIAPATYLMDGPLSELPATRARTIATMESELIEHRAFTDRGDAIRVLRSAGYSTIDVFLLVDEAIYLAKQHVVGIEMGES